MFHTVKLSKSDPTPIYIQLASELSKLINKGLLYEGMKLPTIRMLSKQLSINRDTVVSAYKLLEQQGLVESHIGKGTYISAHGSDLDSWPNLPCKPHICCSHLNFSSNFWKSTLCHELTSQIIEEEGWEAFGDPLYRERGELKQSATSFLETLGILAHFAQTRILTSMDDFLLSLFKLSPKVGVCVETPRDLSISCYLRSLGAKLYEVPVTSNGIDLDTLEKHLHTGNISYIFITPYLQCPTGISYSKDCLLRILDLAQKYDCFIIEDGTYSDFMPNASPLYNLSTDGRVIYLYHFSKVYLPYMKYSFAVLPTQLVKRFKDDIECSFNERFLHYYLKSKALADIRKSIIETCHERYHYLLKRLAPIKDYLSYRSQPEGISLWCHTNEYEALAEFLTQNEIIVAPGEIFTTSSIKGYFRISITNLTYEEIDEVAFFLSEFVYTNSV